MDATLRGYIESINDLPAEVLLGRIVLFTISDEAVSHSSVRDWFLELDLDMAFLPAPIRALDAFKKATSEAKGKYEMSKGRVAHVLCRDVTSTPDYVRRQITREIRDSANKRLSYDSAIECTFYRPTNPQDQGTSRLRLQVQQHNLEPDEVDRIKQEAQAIHQRHLRYYDYLDGMKLRSIVRNYLRHLNAIEVKGGVYFTHVSHDDELGRLAELVNRFGGDCHMNMIPIVDLARERNFFANIFEREASQSLAEIAREARALTANGNEPTSSQVAKLQQRYKQILDSAEEHTLTLQVSQDITTAAAESAQRALIDLQEARLK